MVYFLTFECKWTQSGPYLKIPNSEHEIMDPDCRTSSSNHATNNRDDVKTQIAASINDVGSLKRGVALLKILATAGARGLALTEIAARASIPHPTAHRVLRQLVDERLVARNDELKRYRLGPLAFELGMAGSTMYDLRDLCEDAMDQLSDKTTDTVYMVVRSGFDAVCMHRHEGSFPIRTLVLEVGSRRPLGVGAGGLALLAALDDQERAEVINRVGPKLGSFRGMSIEVLEKTSARARLEGFAIVQDTVNLGVSAVGHVFRDGMDQPLGALSVAALSHRMTRTRLVQIGALLKDSCAEVELRLRSVRSNGWHFGP